MRGKTGTFVAVAAVFFFFAMSCVVESARHQLGEYGDDLPYGGYDGDHHDYYYKDKYKYHDDYYKKYYKYKYKYYKKAHKYKSKYYRGDKYPPFEAGYDHGNYLGDGGPYEGPYFGNQGDDGYDAYDHDDRKGHHGKDGRY